MPGFSDDVKMRSFCVLLLSFSFCWYWIVARLLSDADTDNISGFGCTVSMFLLLLLSVLLCRGSGQNDVVVVVAWWRVVSSGFQHQPVTPDA